MPVTLDNFSAWITVEGREMECYAPEYSEDRKTATCWIASEAGKRFSVCFKDSSRVITTRAHLTLDGVTVCGRILRSKEANPYSNCDTAILSDTQVSNDTVRPFMFAGIQLTDDETSSIPTTKAKDIGIIVLLIKRATLTGQPSSQGVKCQDSRDLESGKVYEKAKKASVHRVSFGDEVTRKVDTIRCLNHEEVAKFVFRYTSYDLLRAREIIPPSTITPSPVADTVQPPIPERQGCGGTQGLDNVRRPFSTALVVKREREDDVIEILCDSDKDEKSRRKRMKLTASVKKENRDPLSPKVIDLTL